MCRSLAVGQPHELAFYVLDWDRNSRGQQFELIDVATGTVLDRQTAVDFVNGQYLVWRVSGNVRVKITRTAGSNAVVSGIFIDAAPAPTTQATFVRTDTTTQGNWKATYGKIGAALANDGSTLPSYVTLTQNGGAAWTWAPSATETRALERIGGGRIASTWYGQRFTMNLGLLDGRSHQVTLHAIDWDRNNRAESIEVSDAATGTVLDRRALADFVGGQYLVWQVTGNVIFTVTKTGGTSNSVVGAVFVD